MATSGVRRVERSRIEQALERMLSDADIRLNGNRAWDIRIHDPRVYQMALRADLMALGEVYVDGAWDCDQIDELVARLLTHMQGIELRSCWMKFPVILEALIAYNGSRKSARQVAKQHYDLGNDLFEAMLDDRMVYSCGYWRNAKTLDEAQEHKLELICQKLDLKPGMKVLDIGGGWGGFAIYSAQRYGVHVTNITVSRQQQELADARSNGLPIENRLLDYRDVEGIFDRIVSVGMFEHVGPNYYRSFMRLARQHLSPDGLFLLHTIGNSLTDHQTNPWIGKYIFPGGHIPGLTQVAQAIEGVFVMEDWHNFGADYDRTLLAWNENFERAWPQLRDRYGERFYRMWRLYLLGCAGSFRARELQLWQLVLSPRGVSGGYLSVR